MQNTQVVTGHARRDTWMPTGFTGTAVEDTALDAETMGPELDEVPDTIFFIKDTEGRYTYANLTLVRRLGFTHRDEVIGRNDLELYPDALGSSHPRQDERVLRGETIENDLQVQVLPNYDSGWCLTHKRPLQVGGKVRGIIGSAQDVEAPDASKPCPASLRHVFDYLHEHYTESVRVYTLAEMAGLSMTQLDRHFRSRYRLTPQQMLTRLRIDSAMKLLRGRDSMSSISLACGFADQSAFTRQFKATVGMTPRNYRATVLAAANS